MAKERKCRLTAEEQEIHKQAVKLRKMTDQQLVDAFNKAKNTPLALSDAPESISTNNKGKDTGILETLLKGLSEGKCKGIASGTVHKITVYCQETGLIK